MDLNVYNLPTMPPNWDSVGIFYITFAGVWTLIVGLGAVYLIANRRSPVLRIRSIGLSLTAILCLHLYWILGQLLYPIGATLPALTAYDVQYFVMGIWLPLGIAFFHASNTRFLYVAKKQRQFVVSSEPGAKSGGCSKGGVALSGAARRRAAAGVLRCWLCRLRNLDYPTRINIYIGMGIVVQILLTVAMWLACRKYHPSFGIKGSEIKGDTVMEQLVDLSRGWEWWPTAFWQLIWTWIVAPILIWQSWNIRDTHGWRLQTMGCCLASLHATPMWLVATYVDGFAPINAYFPPCEWLNIATMFFEIFAVFVPCYLVAREKFRSRRPSSGQSRSTPWSGTSTYAGSSTEKSDEKSDDTSGPNSPPLSPASIESGFPGSRLLSMKVLEHQLEKNPAPLLEFSALRDFSGENIAFLTTVRAWKASWPAPADMDGAKLRDAFSRAIHVYATFVSPRDAEFPLNLSSQGLQRLEAVFKEPTRALFSAGRVNEVSPFGDEESGGALPLPSLPTLLSFAVPLVQPYTGTIPDGFDAAVFDDAEAHVKQLVLTNTWPKFINERNSMSRASGETWRTEQLGGLAPRTVLHKVSTYVQSIF